MGIYGRYGVKLFLSRFGVDNINLAYPDDNLPKLDFLSYFEPWYDGWSSNVVIGEVVNHTDTLCIVESPEFVIIDATNELIPCHIFECSVCVIHFYNYVWLVSYYSFDSHV